MQEAEALTLRRLQVWENYHKEFKGMEKTGALRRPVVPHECRHNAHMYYILLSKPDIRSYLLNKLDSQGINAIFHYIPLHSSPAGKKYGRVHGDLKVTEFLSDCIARLPLWIGMDHGKVSEVVSAISHELGLS